MSFEVIESVFTIKADAIMTTAMAAIMLIAGYAVKGKIAFLRKYCIPAPMVGGVLCMIITFIGHQFGLYEFKFDTYFQSPFMLAFFTTVGLGASVQLLKKGGVLLVIYWAVACTVSIIQNVLGITLGKLTGLEAPYALLASAISMVGGHGAAGSYGATFAELGYDVAMEVGAAAATFGLIFGVVVGGPTARKLIVKNGLTPDDSIEFDDSVMNINAASGKELTDLDIIKNVTAIIGCMALGTVVSGWISKLIGMSFPTYVGAMFVAMLVRNINDKANFFNFSYPLTEKIGDVMLAMYLAIALMGLKLWELLDLLPAVLLIVVCQTILLVILCYFVIFRILGKNYDAAVMCAGLLGHGLGATPTAMVNMTAIKDEYGMSKRAFMIVPIVGAFLVDIIYQPQTIAFIKFFVPEASKMVG